MSKLIEISEKKYSKDRWLDLVFIHGLNGDHHDTWKNPETEDIWPKWIADLYPRIRVLCYDYDIGITNLGSSNTLSIIERTQNTLDLFSVEGIGDVPIGLICHSYGGLLAKSVIRASSLSNRRDYKKVTEQTKFIMFLATPHSGASIASWGKKMIPLLPTNAIEDLEKNAPSLRELNQWYISNYSQNPIETISYCETKKTYKVLIVDADSADLGIPDYPAIPLDEDHISISKLKDFDTHVYKRITSLIEGLKKKFG